MQTYYIAVSDSFSKTWGKIPSSQPLFNFRQVHLLKSVRKEKPRGEDFVLFLQKTIGLNLTTRSLIRQLRKPHTHFALREVPFQSLWDLRDYLISHIFVLSHLLSILFWSKSFVEKNTCVWKKTNVFTLAIIHRSFKNTT